MHAYFDYCEELFNRFLTGGEMLPPEIGAAFQLESCPEPYLLSGEAADPLCFLTTDPGPARNIHDRNRVIGCRETPLAGHCGYMENAARLTAHYVDEAGSSLSQRLIKQIKTAGKLGASGMLELHCLPFRSDWPPTEAEAGAAIDGAPQLATYHEHLRGYLAARSVVALAAVPADKPIADGTLEQPWVARLGGLIGFSRERWVRVPLSADGAPQAALFLSAEGSLLKGICCLQGAADWPEGAGMARLVANLERPPGRLTDPSGRVVRMMVNSQAGLDDA